MAHSRVEPFEDKPEFDLSAKTLASDIPSSEISIRIEDQALDRFGYKAELQRRFGFWSMLGLSCTTMITWEGWFCTAGVGLINGGFAGCVWGFLFCWIGYTAVIASLAELTSMIPTAGGQYHWTYELASPKWRKSVSWMTGWQVVCAWQADVAAVFYIIGTMIQALVVLNWPDYTAQRWQGTLIMWALIIVAVVFNTVLVRMLPAIENMVLVLHCASFFVVLVPLIYFGPHASARDVFTQFSALAGYPSGMSFFVGLLTAAFAFIGCDGAIHMCEEVKQARTAVPNALVASSVINGVFGFAMVIAVMFTIGDITEAIQTETGFLFIDYFGRALDSKVFATALIALLLVLFISCITALLASSSRITWAFARDDGLPGSDWIKKVSPTFRLPLNAISLTCLISFLLSFINIGSAVAFNALVSVTIAAFFGSYAVPISMLAWQRATKRPLDFGPWKLGCFGLITNIIALIFLVITWTFSFFPIAIPVEPVTMNWSILIYGFVMIFGAAWYRIRQRQLFTGPTVIIGHLNL